MLPLTDKMFNPAAAECLLNVGTYRAYLMTYSLTGFKEIQTDEEGKGECKKLDMGKGRVSYGGGTKGL
jgi:hypothetical protein